MNARLAVGLSVVVVALLAAGLLSGVVPGVMNSSGTGSQSTTTTGTASAYVNSVQSLQLRLSANASSTGGMDGGAAVQIRVDEYNTLATANNVSMGKTWANVSVQRP